MSAAILLGGAGDERADPRLVAALRGQGVAGEVLELVDPAPEELLAQLSRLAAGGPVAVTGADVVVSSTPLGALLDDPRVRSGVLVGLPGEHADLQTRDGRVTAVRAAGQDANAVHLGVLLVHPDDVDAAAKGVGDPATVPPDADPIRLLTAALLSGGAALRAVPLGGYVWARPGRPGAAGPAWSRVQGLDEHAVRLAESARSGDGLYSTLVVRRVSRWVTAMALRLRLQPDPVTLASLALGLAAAVCFGTGQRSWLLAGAVLLQVALVLDCVDGELARYRRRFTARGAWLDAVGDRVKEVAAIGGLAAGAARTGDEVWLLAGAAVALQAFRNLFDLGWAMQRADDAARADDEAPDPPLPPAAALAPVGEVRPGSPARTPMAVWARRVGHLPVGERLLVISVGAALGAPGATLLVLLGLGVLSALYMVAAYVARAGPVQVASPRLPALVDIGPPERGLQVLLAAPRRAVPVLPAVLALLELGGVVAITAAGPLAVRVAGFALVAAVSLVLYERTYRVRDNDAAAAGRRLGIGILLVLGLTSAAVGLPGGWLGILLLAAGVLAAAAVGRSAARLRWARREAGQA